MYGLCFVKSAELNGRLFWHHLCDASNCSIDDCKLALCAMLDQCNGMFHKYKYCGLKRYSRLNLGS